MAHPSPCQTSRRSMGLLVQRVSRLPAGEIAHQDMEESCSDSGQGSCPICKAENATSCADLGSQELTSQAPSRLAEHLDVDWLAGWFDPPEEPHFEVSGLHRQAIRVGLSGATVSFTLLVGIATVLTSRSASIGFLAVIAFLCAMFWFRVWTRRTKMAAIADASALAVHRIRRDSWSVQRAAYDRLFFCWRCAVVFDVQSRESRPWYESLDIGSQHVGGRRVSTDHPVMGGDH